jgi:hypothetical protein
VPDLTDNYHYNLPRVAIVNSDNIIVVEEYGQRLLKLNAYGTPLWAVGVVGVDYWAEPHANVIRNFTQIVFTSNWGMAVTEDVDLYLIKLPPQWLTSLP